MKRLKVKKELGIWYYEKEMPNVYNDYDGPVWHLYDENKKYVGTGAFYSELFYYIENGEWY